MSDANENRSTRAYHCSKCRKPTYNTYSSPVLGVERVCATCLAKATAPEDVCSRCNAGKVRARESEICAGCLSEIIGPTYRPAPDRRQEFVDQLRVVVSKWTTQCRSDIIPYPGEQLFSGLLRDVGALLVSEAPTETWGRPMATLVVPTRWPEIRRDRLVFGLVVVKAFERHDLVRITKDGLWFGIGSPARAEILRRLDDEAEWAFAQRAALMQIEPLCRANI